MAAINLKALVDRFLAWKLPETLAADPCVTQPNTLHRTGTSLLTAPEARQMLEHVLGLNDQHPLVTEDQATLTLAVAIADDAARSDIEIYAAWKQVGTENGARGYPIYSLTEIKSPSTPGEDAASVMRGLSIAQRAAVYIRERGNNVPWRMLDVPDMPGWVRFVDAEGRPA
jgi:hypothetical protein